MKSTAFLFTLFFLAGFCRAYDIKVPYAPRAFPGEVRQEAFSLPLDSSLTAILCPEAGRKPAEALATALEKKSGRLLPVVTATGREWEAQKGKNLIVMGSLTDNPAMAELYKKRYAFYDADIPGKGGTAVHCVPSAWQEGRSLLLIGAGGPGALSAACDSVAGRVPDKAKAIGFMRMFKSSLVFPSAPAPDTLSKRFRAILDNLFGSMGPYAEIADWGFLYHLTGDTACGRAFCLGMALLEERAKRAGEWIPEAWTLSYFDLSRMIAAWRLMEADPFFTPKERRTILEVLYAFGRFTLRIPYLREEFCPEGELRQNHTTFLALSAYFVRDYFLRRYGLREFEGLVPLYERAMDGQARSFRPNDDAGGDVYIALAPSYASAYLMARGDETNLKSGQYARTADLLAAVTGNLRTMVTFGDVAAYAPYKRDAPGKGPSGRALSPLSNVMFSTAAWYYRDGQYQWLYRWLTGERPVPDGRAFFIGPYASDIAPEEPSRFCGIFPVTLDASVLQWSSVRSAAASELPREGRTYIDKMSFRASFDPASEYLLMDGLSTLAHGHLDGNTISCLTWKERIWLFDMDYIKTTPQVHNGVMIVNNGACGDPPPLTELVFSLDEKDAGFTLTKLENYSNADWERFVIWKKGSHFLFLDRITSRGAASFRLVSRWRTRGDVRTGGNTLTCVQGDARLVMMSADDAFKETAAEADDPKHNWAQYPYGPQEIVTWKAETDRFLSAGEGYVFSNLLRVETAGRPGRAVLKKAGKDVFLIDGDKGWSMAGLGGEAFPAPGWETDCGLYYIEKGRAALCRLTRLSTSGTELTLDRPAHLLLLGNGLTGQLIIPQGPDAAVRITGAEVAGHSGRSEMRLPAGRYGFRLKAVEGLPCESVLSAAAARATEVSPGACTAPSFTGFGFSSARVRPWPSPVLCAAGLNDGIVAGDSAGALLRAGPEGKISLLCSLGVHSPAEFVAGADADGDGREECFSAVLTTPGADAMGRKILGADLYCHDYKGKLKWRAALTPNYDNAMVTDLIAARLSAGKERTILAATRGWKLHALNPAGKMLFEPFIKYHRLTKVRVMENWAAGQKPLIVAGNEYSTPLNVLTNKGDLLWHPWEQVGSESKSRTEYMGFHLTAMVFLDADRDGRRDIVFGTKYNRVYAVDALSGAIKWTANVGDEAAALLRVDDIATGEAGLAVGTAGGDLVLLNALGARLGALAFGRPVADLKALAIAGKGRTDIAVLFSDGCAAVVDRDLKVRAFHSGTLMEKPLALVCAQGENGVFNLNIVTSQRIVALEYRPHFRRATRFY